MECRSTGVIELPILRGIKQYKSMVTLRIVHCFGTPLKTHDHMTMAGKSPQIHHLKGSYV